MMKPRNSGQLFPIMIVGIAMITIAAAFAITSAFAGPSSGNAFAVDGRAVPNVKLQSTDIALATTPTAEPDWSATLVAFKAGHPIKSPARPVGIFQGAGDAVLLKMGYNIQNSWQRQIGGRWVRADVGSLLSDANQGIVLVTWEGAGAWAYTTPTKAGPMQVIAESNCRLTIQPVGTKGPGSSSPANTSAVQYFDVPGLRFAGSLTEKVPAATISFSITAVAPLVLPNSTPLAPAYP